MSGTFSIDKHLTLFDCHYLVIRGVQIQTNPNKNCKPIKKIENRKNQIFLDVFECPFVKTVDRISD
jgi:hypothetical protein